jgi:hypothetical protein
MMAADKDWEQIFKTTGPRLPNATTPAPLQSEWRAFQKRKLCYRTLYNPKVIPVHFVLTVSGANRTHLALTFI